MITVHLSKLYSNSPKLIETLIQPKLNNFMRYEKLLSLTGLLTIDSKILNIEEENTKQILKDLSRTYPNILMFKNSATQEKLRNVLKAFSNYDKQIRYVQGMNFIVGFFLYHCEEHVAFWLFVSLIEEYELRHIFTEGFPGLKHHSQELERLLQKSFPDICELFLKLNVNVEILMVEWIFSLFSSIIPLDCQMNFYEGFFVEGWTFFYKMCISALLILAPTNNKYSDAEDVYIAVKLGKHDETTLQILQTWNTVIEKAYQIELNV